MNPTTINPLALPSLPLADRNRLPSCAAIYFVLEGDRILYIGRSTNLQQRWMAHHRYSQLNGETRIAWLECSDTELLPEIEEALIAHFNPPLNNTAVVRNFKGFSVYVKPEIHESLKNFAEKQDRSVSNLASHILSEWVRDKSEK